MQSLPCSWSCDDLNHSLRMRLSLFRSTALGKIRFGTIRPSRLCAASLALRVTLEHFPRKNLPCLRTMEKSAPRKDSRKASGLALANLYPDSLMPVSDREPAPALCTPSPDNGPATSGLHTLEKTMRPFPLDYRGLIGAFHNPFPSGKRTCNYTCLGKSCQYRSWLWAVDKSGLKS